MNGHPKSPAPRFSCLSGPKLISFRPMFFGQTFPAVGHFKFGPSTHGMRGGRCSTWGKKQLFRLPAPPTKCGECALKGKADFETTRRGEKRWRLNVGERGKCQKWERQKTRPFWSQLLARGESFAPFGIVWRMESFLLETVFWEN